MFGRVSSKQSTFRSESSTSHNTPPSTSHPTHHPNLGATGDEGGASGRPTGGLLRAAQPGQAWQRGSLGPGQPGPGGRAQPPAARKVRARPHVVAAAGAAPSPPLHTTHGTGVSPPAYPRRRRRLPARVSPAAKSGSPPDIQIRPPLGSRTHAHRPSEPRRLLHALQQSVQRAVAMTPIATVTRAGRTRRHAGRRRQPGAPPLPLPLPHCTHPLGQPSLVRSRPPAPSADGVRAFRAERRGGTGW